MSAEVEILIDGNRDRFLRGETISGEINVRFLSGGKPPSRLELSILWQTEGKGNVDIGVINFESLMPQSAGVNRGIEATGPIHSRFSAELPAIPLSYHGNLLKIHWFVRVRVAYPKSDELVFEKPFLMS
jgi:hypothetical protein